MRPTTPIRRRLRALSTPVGVLVVCSLALAQAFTRSSEASDPAGGARACGAGALDAAGAQVGAADGAGARVGAVDEVGARVGAVDEVGARVGAADGAGVRVGAVDGADARDGAAECAALALGRRDTAAAALLRIGAHAGRDLRRAQARRRESLPPQTVSQVIAAGDRIASAPYIYGGGHGSWSSAGYDCSGSVSYALHGGGLLDTQLDSSQFMSWGDPGPGRWITIYANPGHAFMVVAGRRFDTTGREQSGSRWQAVLRDTSGYVVRHPAGL
jgi:cell wall-associated NlpC family hydrolase